MPDPVGLASPVPANHEHLGGHAHPVRDMGRQSAAGVPPAVFGKQAVEFTLTAVGSFLALPAGRRQHFGPASPPAQR